MIVRVQRRELCLLNKFFSRYVRMLEKQRIIDEHELSQMKEDKECFLEQAVENYLKCLQSGERHNLRVFRLTSLWFDNSGNVEINKMIKVPV